MNTTRNQKQRIRELHNRKAPHVGQIHHMRHDAENGRLEWEAIHQPKEDLDPNNRVDHTSKQSFRKHGMFFDKLGEVVKSRSYHIVSIFHTSVTSAEMKRTNGEG